MIINVPAGFETLGKVFDGAIGQAAYGKGRERHASAGEAYERQQICEIGRRVGPGYCLGQAVKKIYESQRLSPEAAVQELYGALNYVAAQIILIKEGMQEDAGVSCRCGHGAAGSSCSCGGRSKETPAPRRGGEAKWSAAPSPEQAFSERRMAESMPGIVPCRDDAADALAAAMAASAARGAGFSESRMAESMPGIVPCGDEGETAEGGTAEEPALRAQMSAREMRRVCEAASALAECYARLQKEAPAGTPAPVPPAFPGAPRAVPAGTGPSPQFKPTGEELAELQEEINS